MKATLAFVELTVSDWERSRQWVREVLRLDELLVDHAGRFALFAAGSARLALKEGTPTPGGVVLSFEVEQLAPWLAHLGEQAGPIKQSPEGYRRLRLQSPDGHTFVLFEWTQPSRITQSTEGVEEVEDSG